MKSRSIVIAFAVGVLAGCMASGARSPAQTSSGSSGARPSAAEDAGPVLVGTPLLIDRTDLRIGTTVQFTRIPTVSELHDLTLLLGLAHIVLALPAWPADYGPLETLNQIPEQADVVVVLPGYPPSRAAAAAWNYLNERLRIVIVAAGPPPTADVVSDLNAMRHLERVIAQMDEPSRSGFERLQRPLSFWKLVE